MSVFDVVKANVTARQAAEFYGVKVNRYGMCCCPFHSDRHPSMKIDTRFYCFGCGEKGDAIDFVAKYFGLGLKDAAIKICEDLNLEYDHTYHLPSKPMTPKKSDEQIFKETSDHCYAVLSDYLHLLKKWKIEYAPKDKNKEWHPYFCEALNEIDQLEYLLDTLLYGDISDRAFLITNYGRKVIEIDRRLELFRSGDKKKSA